MVYIFAIVVLIYCIIKYDIYNSAKGKSEWFLFIAVYLTFLSALAYRLGGDGFVYMMEYGSYSISDGFGWKALTNYSGRMPGWVLLTKICRCISPDYALFKFVHAVIINLLFFRSINHFASRKFSAVLAYFILLYFDFNFQLLRQSLAIAIVLNAIPFLMEKKPLAYILVCLIACSFHESAIVAILIPIVLKLGDGKRALLIYSSAFVLFVILLGTIAPFLTSLGQENDALLKVSYYSSEIDSSGEISGGVNILINVVIPTLFICFSRNRLPNRTVSSLALSYCFMYSLSLFFPIFYRVNDYFILFFYLIYVDLFVEIANFIRSKRLTLSHSDLSGFSYLFMVLAFITIKARKYLLPYGDTAIPSYVQFYPYSSILFNYRDLYREMLFSYM